MARQRTKSVLVDVMVRHLLIEFLVDFLSPFTNAESSPRPRLPRRQFRPGWLCLRTIQPSFLRRDRGLDLFPVHSLICLVLAVVIAATRMSATHHHNPNERAGKLRVNPRQFRKMRTDRMDDGQILMA